MKLLALFSGPYWYALYLRERATRDDDAAEIARLKRENKRQRVKLLQTTALLKEATRRDA